MKEVGKTTRPFRCDLNQIPSDYTVEVRNRFKGLDLIERVPDELWTEVHDIVQETGIKTIPKINKCKKAKWLSEEALQISLKRREAKSKGEKERYSHLNAEFQGIARRDKKAFLSDQCKEIEENNRMVMTRDLFKKIRDTKEMGIPGHLTCLLRNLYAGQEATVRTEHGTRLVPNRERSMSGLYIVILFT